MKEKTKDDLWKYLFYETDEVIHMNFENSPNKTNSPKSKETSSITNTNLNP